MQDIMTKCVLHTCFVGDSRCRLNILHSQFGFGFGLTFLYLPIIALSLSISLSLYIYIYRYLIYSGPKFSCQLQLCLHKVFFLNTQTTHMHQKVRAVMMLVAVWLSFHAVSICSSFLFNKHYIYSQLPYRCTNDVLLKFLGSQVYSLCGLKNDFFVWSLPLKQRNICCHS